MTGFSFTELSNDNDIDNNSDSYSDRSAKTFRDF